MSKKTDSKAKVKSNNNKAKAKKSKESNNGIENDVKISKTAKKGFRKLTDEDIQYITTIYYSDDLNHVEKCEKLTKKFGVTDRTIREWWVKLELSKPASKLPPQLQRAQLRNIDEDTDILIVTSAQNTTALNYKLWGNIKTYIEVLKEKFNKKAQIIVIPTRYRNPTSPAEQLSKKHARMQWWDVEVDKYLFYNKIQFGDCVISSDSHIRPTKKEPLKGMPSHAGNNHLVVGSPRIHLETAPRFRGDALRVRASTGALSVKNYSRSLTGDDGFFNHTYGFTIIEKKDKDTCYIPRSVSADTDGTFTDLNIRIKDGEHTIIKKVDGLVMGDIHRELLDMKLYEATKRLTKSLRPKNVVLHDVLDGYRFNPHERRDYYLQRQKILQGKFLIKDEVEQAVEFPKMVKKDFKCDKILVIESNHDWFLDRHINDMDWKKDLHNSATYLEYASIMQSTDLTEHGCLFGYLVNKRYENKKYVDYIECGRTVRINGIVISSHGESGTNGSKGTVKQFASSGSKTTTAHTHSPSIMNGSHCVGLSATLKQHYTRKGMSSHAHAHDIIHDTGKRQLLIFGDDYSLSGLL
ncbi:A1-like protein [Tenacibaculum phage pT24]|uniref:A1-like protein n=1 Tax=Tenacibaculum phage pT24 TaxID=1880590 RepID=A0A1B4XWU2_9CAUD|nr:DNA transfer protein [Tenacibaculum phage pT24]BAV39268.1 A1-like protein [Tenacibaculum phage pT24]